MPGAHDGARLREGLIAKANLASKVWPDTAYRSKETELWLGKSGMTSRIHRKAPKARPMPDRSDRARQQDEVDDPRQDR